MFNTNICTGQFIKYNTINGKYCQLQDKVTTSAKNNKSILFLFGPDLMMEQGDSFETVLCD